MNLFGWKSAGRASSRPVRSGVPLARASSWSAGEWPRSYERQVREGYLDNAVAQRAVRMIAEGAASITIKSTDETARGLVRATSAGQALIETVATHILLHGNAYVELLQGPDGGAPTELYALRPERVSVEGDARGWPVAFRYRVGGATSRLPADRIIHIRQVHPLDDHYGLGCLGAASGAVAIHNAAAKWNKALLDNAARPSGALLHEAGEALSNEQFDRLKGELEAGFQGSLNAGRPMLLEGGLKWQSLSLTPQDMDFIALKSAAAREIALAFGVPPVLLGLPGDATYANYREANKALWKQAILPLAGKILDALSEGLGRWFPGLALAIDMDALPALAEDRERLWAQLEAADFLTVNEKRELAGFVALDVPVEGAVAGVPPPEPVSSPAEGVPEVPETKFNPWHDHDNGQFTFAGQGMQSVGSSTAAMASPPAMAKRGSGGQGVGTGGDTTPDAAGMITARPRPAVVQTSDGRRIVNRPAATYRAAGLNGKGYVPRPEDEHLLARIIYAESLSNPEDFEAIGWSVVNRVGERQFGKTLHKVIHQRNAYEVLEVGGGPKGNTRFWNETDSLNPLTEAKLPPDRRAGWRRAQIVANGILGGRISDPTGGATYFLSSGTYVRGSPGNTGSPFFNLRLKERRFIDSPYISRSTRKRQNHFFVELPSEPTKAKNFKRNK